MERRGSTSVTIEKSSDKRMITGTFGITLSENFLPIQLIYAGKTTQSIPKVAFPKIFSLSANSSHYPNTEESLKFLDEIVIPYVVVRERSKLELLKEHKALMVMDVFTGQMTEDVVKKYQDNNIIIVNVPKNMTKNYQPLDLTVNRYCKKFLKRKFSQWYTAEVSKQLTNKVALEDVEVKLRLTTLKPLHADWIIEFFDEMTTNKGNEIIENGWLSSGITDAINLGLENLPSLDPFDELDPMMKEIENEAESNVLRMTAIACLSAEKLAILGSNNQGENGDNEEEECEWVALYSQADERNAFDIFDDEE